MTFLKTLRQGTLLMLIGCLAPFAAHAANTYGSTAPSATVAPQVVQQASTQASNLLAGRISQAVSNVTGSLGGGGFGGGGGGMGGGGMGGGGGFSPTPGPRSEVIGGNAKAAGDPVGKTAFWVNGGNAWVSNDQSGVNFSGTIQTGLVGMDHQFNDRILGGVALGYEHPDIKTKFNAGTFEGNNWAVSPYVGYIINNVFSVNAVAGYTWVNYDTTRSNGAVSGSISGERMFGNLNAVAATRIDNWYLGSTIGYMYLLETQEAYTERGTGAVSNPENQIRLGQWRWTNKVGHSFIEEWGGYMPYASVRLEYDSSHTPSGVADAIGTPVANDRFGATFGLGADVAVGNDTTFSLEGSSTEFREHLSTYSVNGTLRVKF
ncbi:MAG: autotransporter outer membrane beta-barrel domain-containing protein [Bacteroidales bacterium]